MGVTVEWHHVRHPFFRASVHPKGTTMPDGQRVTDDFALVIETDECFVLEGTAARLVRVLDKLKAELLEKVAEQPAAVEFVPDDESHAALKAQGLL